MTVLLIVDLMQMYVYVFLDKGFSLRASVESTRRSRTTSTSGSRLGGNNNTLMSSSGGGGGGGSGGGSSDDVASGATAAAAAASSSSSSLTADDGGGGVERRTQREVYVPMLLGVLDGVLAARRAGALCDEVRSSVHTFLHCMADSLGRDLLPHLPAIVDAYDYFFSLLFLFIFIFKKRIFLFSCAFGASPRNLGEFTRFLSQVKSHSIAVLI